MNVFKISILFASVTAVLIYSCGTAKNSTLQFPDKGAFFKTIEEYGIFQGQGLDLVPHDRLIKYEVVNALFTDYAEKDRFVYMPEGQRAELLDDGFFKWPTGTMIVKNFYYNEESAGVDRMMETRLLIKEEAEWKAVSYVWDDSQKTATLKKVGDILPMHITHGSDEYSFDYVVPNKNQCKSCHNKNEKIDPLGFKLTNLDRAVTRDGVSISQLDYLAEKGVINLGLTQKKKRKMVAYTDEAADLQDRALAYLDMNCGHCHRPEGPGNTSGLFLQYDETRANHLGYCKGPVAAGRGSGGHAFDISPGNADASILYHRMASTDPGVMMPEIGRSLSDKKGLQLIKEWINNIDYNCETHTPS